MASELEGVLRVGAVNCADEWMFCRERQIFGYPSLIFFPGVSRSTVTPNTATRYTVTLMTLQNEVYQGDRSTSALIGHALNKIAPTIQHVTKENVVALTTEWRPYNERDWVVDVCHGDGGERACLEHTARRKLAAMLEGWEDDGWRRRPLGLMNVGTIDCTTTELPLCARESGVFHFPRGTLDVEHATPVESLDAREIAAVAIGKLPDVRTVDGVALAVLVDEVP